MLKKLVRQMRLRFLRKALNRAARAENPQSTRILSASLDKNLKLVREAFQHCSDVIIREFAISLEPKVRAAVVFVDGLVDKTMLQENIMRPLMVDASNAFKDVKDNVLNLVKKSLLTVGEAKKVTLLEELVAGVLGGGAAVLIDGFDVAFLACITGWEARRVEEPQTEVVIRGPREGFVEVLRVLFFTWLIPLPFTSLGNHPGEEGLKAVLRAEKLFLAGALLLFLATSLSGCWNRRELNTLAIVVAMGLDKAEEEKKAEVLPNLVEVIEFLARKAASFA